MNPKHDFNEGDYIKTKDNLFFAVKGNRHPPDKVIAYLRYTPDPTGNRDHNGQPYRRHYDIPETTRLLQQNHPQYINHIPWLNQKLQSIPHQHIQTIYKPRQKLRQIQENPQTKLEKLLKRFTTTLTNKAKITTTSIGITGSILIDLHTDKSDIDLNVYGRNKGRKIYTALKKLRKQETWINPYTPETIKQTLNNRWKDTEQDQKKLATIETSKILHGKINTTDYFIRLLLPEKDTTTSTPIRKIKIKTMITSASDAIYTPCTYKITENKHHITELKSYRGKFTEQAKTGDQVELKGTLEKVTNGNQTWNRIILGQQGDYLIPIRSSKDNYLNHNVPKM